MGDLFETVRKYKKRMRLLKSLVRNRKKIPTAVEALLKAGKSQIRR